MPLHLSFLILFLFSIPGIAQERLEIRGTIDGTDQITIRHDGATWRHLSGDLSLTHLRFNGIIWSPSEGLTLPNSDATIFLTNNVNFMAAHMQLLLGRDTIVMQKEKDELKLSFGDTPSGPANYSLVITFPETPTLLVEADIDGSDELQVSATGARWVHKHWSLPGAVQLNGINWFPNANGFLFNTSETTFLPGEVEFRNAVVLEQSGRDLLTVRPALHGIIINFADDPVGAGKYRALIAFPPSDPTPEALIPVVSAAQIQAVSAAAISVSTVAGKWYELESRLNLGGAQWKSTGGFILGNGETMTIFDPVPTDMSKFYRIVTRPRP